MSWFDDCLNIEIGRSLVVMHDSADKVHDGINRLIDEIPNFIPLFKLKVDISYRVSYFRFITLLEHEFQYFIHGHPHKLTHFL